MRRSALAVCIATLAAAPIAVAPRSSHACGGFFCAQTPIDQSGEYILFSIEPGGVRAYIQIQYTGKAEDFAWVVPVMSVPKKISVGVQQVFTTLLNMTKPQHRLDWSSSQAGCLGLATRGGDAAGGVPAASPSSPGGVDVIDKGEVGPYNYAIVKAEEAAKLKAWLDKEGFQQPPSAEPALMHYVKQPGFVFVAIKLKRGAMTGEIQPLVLDMEHEEACVPLVLTRIAATPDMPITTFVLGKHRAVPRNWFEVEINPKRIDWLRNGSNYGTVVTNALNEAAGRGFVTEFAGDTARWKNQALFWAPNRFALSRLQGITSPSRFVQTLLQLGLPRDPLIQTLLRNHIPMPMEVRARGVTDAQFYNALAAGSTAYDRELAQQKFDAAAFIKDLDERIVTPLMEAQQLLDRQPYLTRLFSTVSPDEMTRDPLFDQNPDLRPVSNVHTAQATGMCMSDGRLSNVVLRFENGETQGIPGSVSPFGGPEASSYAPNESYSQRIQLMGPTGPGIPVTRGRVASVDQLLQTMEPKMVRQLLLASNQPVAPSPAPAPGTTPPVASDPAPTKSSGGCSIAPRGTIGLSLITSLCALAALRARRRTRRG